MSLTVATALNSTIFSPSSSLSLLSNSNSQFKFLDWVSPIKLPNFFFYFGIFTVITLQRFHLFSLVMLLSRKRNCQFMVYLKRLSRCFGWQAARTNVMPSLNSNGYHPSEDCASSSLSHYYMVGNFNDSATVEEFAKRCGVLTVDIEHVDVATLENSNNKELTANRKALLSV